VVLGGDCSVVVGAMMGARRLATRGPVGLAYIDGHADFATPEESSTGSAASMCLAMVAGHGRTALARMGGDAPLVRPRDISLLGRRDTGSTFGNAALGPLGVHDVPWRSLTARRIDVTVSDALTVLTRPDLSGFWVHVDADVFDASIMPAVDSPMPDGPDLEEMVQLVAPLVRHPKALGMQLTIYDPALDTRGACAERLVTFLERALV
jgi:arginase